MPKLTFVVGPLGSGISELAGQIAQIYRNRPLPESFDFPPEYDNGVLMKYVSHYAHGGIEEARHMISNDLTFDFENYKTLLESTINSYPSASALVLSGAGLTKFISQFKSLYPEAEIMFVKRTVSRAMIETTIAHAVNPEVCSCGVTHTPLNDEVISYIENINTELLDSVNDLVSDLGYTWTTRDHGGINSTETTVHSNANFLSPIMLAVYKPS